MIDDVPQIMRMDIENGLLYVQGKPYQTKKGMLIGSPIAAGCASILVARREHLDDAKNDLEVAAELKRKTIRKRWLDDAVHIRKGRLSKRAFEAYKRSKRQGF